jgi:hypothetical protein
METATQDSSADSSTAFEIPTDGAAYAEWRQTGKLPEPSHPKSKAASTTAKEDPASQEGNPAPASEPGVNTQEKKKSPAAIRLDEVLADLKRAGLTPDELKTFRREAQKPVDTAKAVPEQPVKPTELKAPLKPKMDAFRTFEEYESACDKWTEDVADYKAAKAIEDYRREQAQNAATLSVNQKMAEAKTRYGDDATDIISRTARAIIGDPQIPTAVSSIINGSPVWSDVLYAMGSKPGEIEAFIELAKANPGDAIRKAIVYEQLVQAELAKGGKQDSEYGEETPRDPAGKFTKPPPEKPKTSDAPRPPSELSGRGTTPRDEAERAVAADDFTSYKRAQNAKEMRLRRG